MDTTDTMNKITTQSDTSSMKVASPSRKDNDNSVSGTWIFNYV